MLEGRACCAPTAPTSTSSNAGEHGRIGGEDKANTRVVDGAAWSLVRTTTALAYSALIAFGVTPHQSTVHHQVEIVDGSPYRGNMRECGNRRTNTNQRRRRRTRPHGADLTWLNVSAERSGSVPSDLTDLHRPPRLARGREASSRLASSRLRFTGSAVWTDVSSCRHPSKMR